MSHFLKIPENNGESSKQVENPSLESTLIGDHSASHTSRTRSVFNSVKSVIRSERSTTSISNHHRHHHKIIMGSDEDPKEYDR